MFDEKYLESTEFYKRRYGNHLSYITIPLFIGLLFAILFSLFTKREVTVKSTGEVIPRKVVSYSEKNNIASQSKNSLYFENGVLKEKYEREDTIITDINPDINKKTPLSVEFFVSSQEIYIIKSGQSIKMSISQYGSKSFQISGRVKHISMLPTIQHGNLYYQCLANIYFSDVIQDDIKYGYRGNVYVIVGQKSWFNYYKDKIMGEH